jgi:ribosomal protein L13E
VEIDNRVRLQKAQSNSKATGKSKALNYLKCIVSLPWREIRERGYAEKREVKNKKSGPFSGTGFSLVVVEELEFNRS